MINPQIPKHGTRYSNPLSNELFEPTWYRWLRDFLRSAQREWLIKTTQTADFTAERDAWYPVDTTGGAVTVTLPAPSTLLPGARVGIKSIGGSNTLTVQDNDTELVEGAASVTVQALDFRLFLFNGTTWWIS